MRIQLTDLAIRKLSLPKSGNIKYWDKKTPAFGVRCSPNVKSFVVMYGQKRRLKTLGRYPSMTLSDARKAALKLLYGSDQPQAPKSLSQARNAYLEECGKKNRPATVRQYKHFLMPVSVSKLSDVQRSDIDISSPHAVMAWRVFFNWCIRNELVERNPFNLTKVTWNSRTRLLTDDEVERILNYEYPPYSNYLKLLFLTGQRIGQFKAFTVQDNTLVFPASSMKNRKEHSIPLTDWTASILDTLHPFNGWSKAKRRVDAHTGVEDWVHHDARRYFSTTMASLQVPLHVTEVLLSHTSGQVSGVAATYNRYNYLIEMREALTLYEEHLKKVVDD